MKDNLNLLDQTEEYKKAKGYWLTKLAGELSEIKLPYDFGALPEPGNSRYQEILARPLSEKILSKSNGKDLGLYVIMAAALKVLLYKLTAQKDITILSPIYSPAGSQKAIAGNHFVLFRDYLEPTMTFKELLSNVSQTVSEGYKNQYYPLDHILDILKIQKPAVSSLVLIYENIHQTDLQDGAGNDFTCQLMIFLRRQAESLEVEFEYPGTLFTRETVQRIAKSLVAVIEAGLSDPQLPLKEFEIINAADKKKIFAEFNHTEAEYPHHKTIHQLFEEQVERNPENIAVVFGDQKLSFGELNARSNRLARRLREYGLTRDSIAGMVLERSLEMMVGIMAVVKAGGAYLPIHPDYPGERIKYLLTDSQARFLLTQNRFLHRLQAELSLPGVQIIGLEDERLYDGDGTNLARVNTPTDLVYVIYTSGSTGKPKGVMIEHYSLVNRLHWMQKQYPIGPSDAILQKTPYTFDVSVWELFWWSIPGARLCFLAPGGEKEPREIVTAVEANRITTLHFVPSMLSLFLDYIEDGLDLNKLRSLRQVFASGEALTLQQAQRFNRSLHRHLNVKLHNLYGPTEATVDVSYFDCSTGEDLKSVPIGKPIDNTGLYILDENHWLQPIGFPGELCISGAGLARGYLNRPELTAEKFVIGASPPWEGIRETPQRIYRTGDLARWAPDGNIEYLGRIDYQVKIRGLRIELGEIEGRLNKHPQIKEAVVTARENEGGEKYLCAYYTATEAVSISVLKEFLLEELPDYMVPAFLIQLDQMPLSPNGKIDRKALVFGKRPELDASIDTGVEYQAPANETEQKLTEICQEILHVDRIGTRDNFFDLGGNSLNAVILSGRIHKEFNVEAPLREIFLLKTIGKLAEYIENSQEDLYTAIQPVDELEYYPVSSAQKRLFLLNQSSPDATNYNMFSAVIIEGGLDKSRFEDVLKLLVKRHESLRTSFELIGGQPVQKVHQDLDFKIAYLEVPGEAGHPGTNVEDLVMGFVKPFNLNTAPLLRVSLVKLATNKHLFIFDMHHIISDGISMNLLVREFIDLYQGAGVPDLRIQYKDFAVWQNQQREKGQLKKQEEYWLKQLTSPLPTLAMPLDFARLEARSFVGHTGEYIISEELTGKLESAAKRHDLTLNTLLLSLYSLLLNQYSGQNDLLIGSLAAGRRHPDLENVIGVFMNFLPVRIKINPGSSLADFLSYVRELTLAVYQNQDYPFEEMVEKAGIPVDPSRNPIFDTMLVFHNENEPEPVQDINGLRFSQYPLENNTTTLDFKMDLYRSQGNELICRIQYNTDLFLPETIANLFQHFLKIILRATESPDWKLAELDLWSAEEKREISAKRERNSTLDPSLVIAVTATFTIEPIAGYLKWWLAQFAEKIAVKFASYNQVFQELLDPSSLLSSNTGINIVLVRFEDWIRDTSREGYKKLEKNYGDLVEIFRNKPKTIPYFVGIFPVATHLSLGAAMETYIESMYKRWTTALTAMDNVQIIDFRLAAFLYSIEEVFDQEKDKAGHLPFSDEFYAAMATMLARKVCSYRKPSFKTIILDCDNTLWQGVCGEEGAMGVKVTEPHRAFQNLLIQKYNEGMLLALCSKNNEADVWEVFAKNEGMILRPEHIAAWRINWQAKSQNIKELATELNIGVDSFIFLDDSATECAEVMANCSEVLTIRLPGNPAFIPAFLRHIWALDIFKVTEEDRKRTRMYQAEKKRKEAKQEEISLDSFLKGLELKLSMKRMEHSQIDRVSQLTQRTNQFNLSVIRRNNQEIEALAGTPGVTCWTIEVSDRFGDYGLVGVAITKDEGTALFIDTFLLSCRVLARNIENAILSLLKRFSREKNLSLLKANFVATEKNSPIRGFMEKTGWEAVEQTEKSTLYTLPVEKIPDSIDFIECFYQEPLPPKETGATPPGDNETGWRATHMAENGSPKPFPDVAENAWEVVYPGNGESLRHKSYLLPLKNHTARKLLQLPLTDIAPNKMKRAEYRIPGTQHEKRLAAIWEEILNVPNIGVHDNFFDLGGHSLKAATLISRIHKEWKVDLPLRAIFDLKTVRELAKYLLNLERSVNTEIQPVEPRERYPVSSAQKRLFILNQIEGASTAYNQPGVFMIHGPLDRGRLEEAFNLLVKRHETLRTSIQLADGQLYQYIQPELNFQLEDAAAREDELPEIIPQWIRPFDFSKAPLLRAVLCKIDEEKHLLLYDMSHAITDGISLGIFIRDLADLYEGKPLPKLRIQYKDYAAWQNNIEAGQSQTEAGPESLAKKGFITKQEGFWLRVFQGEIPILNLPTDYPRPAMQSFEGAAYFFNLDMDLTRDIHKLCQATETTLYMVFLAAYNVLLAKYTGQEDIIIGSPVSGRPYADLDNLIGMFVNTLAMRNRPAPKSTFKEFLESVKENSLQAMENQSLQFESLIEKLELKRDLSRNPLFDTMFTLQNMEMPEINVGNLTLTPFEYQKKIAKFDLTLEAVEFSDGISLNFEYCTKLFKAPTMERMALHFRNLLQAIVKNPFAILSEFDMLSENEKIQLTLSFNNTRAEYAKDRTIHGLFEEQVEKSPDRTAVIFEDQRAGARELTYRELNQRANQLAGQLRKRGVTSDSIIPMVVERSLEMSIGIIAVLKAGGAYLPINPDDPRERIRYMVEDSGATMILTQHRFVNELPEMGKPPVEVIDLEDGRLYEGPPSNPLAINRSIDLAYVIYTSGSTGQPKGAAIEHYSLVNRLHWMQKKYPIGADDVILQKTPYTFDVSVWEQLWWAICGAKVCFLIPGGEKDPALIINTIFQAKITLLHFVPSMLSLFLDYLEGRPAGDKLLSLKRVIASGEALSPELVEKFNRLLHQRYGTTLHNLYGPTEATIDVSFFDCFDGAALDPVPIGKPIDNIRLYILDPNYRLQPVGVPGELMIAGDGLARGYLNKPELTAERFVVVRAFRETPVQQRIYQTGDLARWRPDGNIEYLGRLDHQVKIRGLRIELGEIESRLLEFGAVKEAVVVARDEKSGNKYLCAYVTADQELVFSDLKNHLLKKLPDYMAPSYFIQLEKMPLTPNHKVDRRALPEPDADLNPSKQYKPPENALEAKLVEIWERVLGVEKLGVQDNFFDRGGHSLLAVKLEVELEKEGFRAEYSDVYKYQTVREYAFYLKETGENPSDMEAEKTAPDRIPGDIIRKDGDLAARGALEAAATGAGATETISLGSRLGEKLIPGIEPFNEVFYHNCFFNALFPVIRHFEKDLLPVLVNDIIIYDYDPGVDLIPKGMKYLPIKSPLQLLEDLGLGVNVKIDCALIIEEIVSALTADRPVIIKVDCFYESIREDAYLKNHWVHDLLLYGYHQSEQLFYVIEHEYRDTLSYKKQALSFSDVKAAYHGFQANFNPDLTYDTYLDFYLKNPTERSGNDLESRRRENIRVFAENVASKREAIFLGLENLRTFTGKLPGLTEDEAFIMANLETFVAMLNNIINAKYVEKYKILQLLGGHPLSGELTNLTIQIIDGWNQFRSVIARIIYSNSYQPKRLAAAATKLSSIFQLERAYFDKLSDLLSTQLSQ